MEFIGFADVNQFIKISGISKFDLEEKVFPDLVFQEKFMYRFGKGGKRYIKIQPAIEYIEEHIMTKETDL